MTKEKKKKVLSDQIQVSIQLDIYSIFRFCYLHEANAAGQEVHEEREERGHVVDLRRLCDATQRLQRSDDFLFDSFFLADLSKVFLVDEVKKTLLERVKHLQRQTEGQMARQCIRATEYSVFDYNMESLAT